MHANEVSEVPTQPTRIKTRGQLTGLEREQLHTAVAALTAKLFRQRFGQEMREWTPNDSSALDNFLLMTRLRTMDEMEPLLKNYFASDDITTAEPWMFIRDLFKYGSGPLDNRGVSKTWLAKQRAEMARESSAVALQAKRREEATQVENRDQRLTHATAEVIKNLTARGYSVFRAVYPATCHLLAISPMADTARVSALRIIVTTDVDGISTNPDAIVATVKLGQFRDVAYSPELQ
jgi:hypothetical protein